MRRKQFKVYETRRQILLTLIFIAIPFLFLLFFADISHIAAPKLYSDLAISFVRIVIAYVIAALLGWFFAVLFYRGKRSAIALPVFDVLQSFPTYSALPLAVLVWGANNFTVIFFLVLAIIWPIFFSTISSLKLVRPDWEEAVEISGLSGLDYLRKFLIPVSAPGLFTGSIIGLGDGWEALIATEIIVGVQSGLGPFFQFFSQNTVITAFGIFGLMLFIFSTNKIVWLPLLEWSHKQMEE